MSELNVAIEKRRRVHRSGDQLVGQGRGQHELTGAALCFGNHDELQSRRLFRKTVMQLDQGVGGVFEDLEDRRFRIGNDFDQGTLRCRALGPGRRARGSDPRWWRRASLGGEGRSRLGSG